MNKVVLVGRLTKDPDLRQTQSGVSFARFNVAVDRRTKNDEGPTADFPSVVAWGKTADFIDKYFRKGMRIGIVGRIQTGSYEKDGQTHYTTDVVAETAEFVESKKQDADNSNSAKPKVDEDGFMDIPDGIPEDLPF